MNNVQQPSENNTVYRYPAQEAKAGPQTSVEIMKIVIKYLFTMYGNSTRASIDYVFREKKRKKVGIKLNLNIEKGKEGSIGAFN